MKKLHKIALAAVAFMALSLGSLNAQTFQIVEPAALYTAVWEPIDSQYEVTIRFRVNDLNYVPSNLNYKGIMYIYPNPIAPATPEAYTNQCFGTNVVDPAGWKHIDVVFYIESVGFTQGYEFNTDVALDGQWFNNVRIWIPASN